VSAAPAGLLAVALGAGDPRCRCSIRTGRTGSTCNRTRPTSRAGVRVAVGDVNGDGFPDVVTAAGFGGGPHIAVFSGRDGSVLRSFLAYDPSVRNGTWVAVGDVDGDGYADIITGAGPGGASHVKVFSGKDNALMASFYAYDPAARGGVTCGRRRPGRDGRADIITGAGLGGGPHVVTFNGRDFSQMQSFFAYGDGVNDGVLVAGRRPGRRRPGRDRHRPGERRPERPGVRRSEGRPPGLVHGLRRVRPGGRRAGDRRPPAEPA